MEKRFKIKMLLIIGIVGGVVGATSVALGMALLANYIWIVSNPALAYMNYLKEDADQKLLWIVYSCLAIFGVLNLSGVL